MSTASTIGGSAPYASTPAASTPAASKAAALNADSASRPRVSILTSTHNAAAFIERFVAALESQSVRSWECLVVDDGSTDGTFERFEQRVAGDARFRLFKRPRTGFPAANRSFALERARAELIAFCDQDDFWWPSKLEHQLAAMASHPQAVFCHTGRRFAAASESSGGDPRSAAKPTGAHVPDAPVSDPRVDSLERALLARCAVTCSSVVARRQAVLDVGGIHGGLAGVDDYHLWLRLAAKGPFLWLRSPLLTCSLHGRNLSALPAVLATGLEAMVRDFEQTGALETQVLKAVRAQAFKARGVALFVDRPLGSAYHLARAWACRPRRRTAAMAAGVTASTLIGRRRRLALWRRIQERRGQSLVSAVTP